MFSILHLVVGLYLDFRNAVKVFDINSIIAHRDLKAQLPEKEDGAAEVAAFYFFVVCSLVILALIPLVLRRPIYYPYSICIY